METAGVQMVEGLSFYYSIQQQVATADPAVDEAIVGFYTADPATLTPEMRDEVLSAINRVADDLLLAQSDIVAEFPE
jgi:hypothetical protein